MDSSDRQASSTLGGWLSSVLPGSRSLRLQTAYYADGALWSVQDHLTRLLDDEGFFHLVLGGNPNAARLTHLQWLLDYLAPYPRAKVLAVIPGPTNMLVHSKMYHVTHDDHSLAWVGSANFTAFGTSTNFEAGLALDGHEDADAIAVDAVRDRLDGWFQTGHPWARNIVEVSTSNLPQLLGWRVATRQETGEEREVAKLQSSGRESGIQTLPSLPFLDVPSRPKSRPPAGGSRSTTGAAGPGPQAAQGQPHHALPPGVVATVKVLVAQDIRGLSGLSGTWYLSLGLPWQSFFGTIVPPPSTDPRIETLTEARLVSLPTDTAASGQSSTSLQLEGAAAKTKTNLNARVNLSKQLATELRTIAAVHAKPLPKTGDLVVAEYLGGTPMVVRLTYIGTSDRGYAALRTNVGKGGVTGYRGPSRGYGWLAAPDLALLPSW